MSDLPLRIQYRPLLVSGQLRIYENAFVLLIDNEQSPAEQRIAVWHELIHMLRYVEGKDHDEEKIDTLAKFIAAAEESVYGSAQAEISK